MRRMMACLGMILAFGLWTASAQAQERTLRYSDINAQSSGAGIFTDRFAELVRNKTEGRVAIEVYYGGTLSGFDIAPVQTGIVDLTQWGLSTDFCPFMSVLQAPYLYDGDEQLLRITHYDSPIFKRINECLESGGTNVRLVTIYSWGFQNLLTTDRPVRSLADVQGLKIRVVPLKIFMETVRAMGGTPTPMPWSEVMTSLMTGVIDGTGMPIVYVVPAGLHEIEKHYALTRHNPTLSGVYINADVWNGLSPADQQSMLESGEEARQHLHEYMEKTNARYLEEIKVAGVEVVPFEALAIDEAAIRDGVREVFKDDWGETYDEILRLLDQEK